MSFRAATSSTGRDNFQTYVTTLLAMLGVMQMYETEVSLSMYRNINSRSQAQKGEDSIEGEHCIWKVSGYLKLHVFSML